ncbi:MAG TPA: hypothetical protein VKR32_12395 [Puia sp.]|nr:hypothetical protein [Puia sp.]
MTNITDEFMMEMIPKAKNYCAVILRKGPNFQNPGVEKIIWEHGRRNFALREQRLLCIVCSVRDGTDVCGIGIFNANVEETKKIIDEDPGVKASVFIYDLHGCRGFPGDSLAV